MAKTSIHKIHLIDSRKVEEKYVEINQINQFN
jgi:hypothetical protein